MDCDLQNLLEAIKSSDVVENKIELLRKAIDSEIVDKSDVAYLVQCLSLWEDFTCLDVSQCMLNKAILQLVSKHVDSAVSGSLELFVELATKMSQWCAKHLTMFPRPLEESQEEEHSTFFFQLLLDYFGYSVSTFAAITRNCATDNASQITVQKFVAGQLNLVKEVISDAKRVGSFSSDILKSTREVIDAVVCLCKEYSQAVDWEGSCAWVDSNKGNISSEAPSIKDVRMNITALTVESLSDIGFLAAKGGGNLVAILNTSWKSLITLLQLGVHTLGSKVKIVNIVLKLVSLINESLRSVAEIWSSSLREFTVTEARRAFLPVKFYLINAVKLTTLFPNQVCVVHKDITFCLLMISKFRFSLSQENHLKPAGEVITDLLEKSSIDLLYSIISANEIKLEVKHEILDSLFTFENCKNSCQERSLDSSLKLATEIHSEMSEAVAGKKVLLLGQLTLFLSLLKYSFELDDLAKLAVAAKLDWLLNVLTDEVGYCYVLSSQLPSVRGTAKLVEFYWEPMYLAVVLALKTFMIVASSSPAWEELETFLLENFLHPHFICQEIVMELWSFLIRHADVDTVNRIVDKFCLVLRSLSLSASALNSSSTLAKVARSFCVLLNNVKQSVVERVYNSLFVDNNTESFSDAALALLMEGFPLNSLSDRTRNNAKMKIVSGYLNILETFDGKLPNDSMFVNSVGQVSALSACVRTLDISQDEVDERTLMILPSVIHNYRESMDKRSDANFCHFLGEMLAIISNRNQLYAYKEMDNIIFELQKLFISSQSASNDHLYGCMPNLALFMAGLSHTEMAENDDCRKSCAVWGLYHMLLKERHWAMAHLAITAFGYFCARTSCNQLWRFVPEDAALAFDPSSGRDPDPARFMSELKAVLERERALDGTTFPGELQLLEKEGKALRELAHKGSIVTFKPRVFGNIDTEKQPHKKRKLPEGIYDGVEMLQKGLKAIGDGLSKWQPKTSDSVDLQTKFSNRLSCLEEVIDHFVGLAHRT